LRLNTQPEQRQHSSPLKHVHPSFAALYLNFVRRPLLALLFALPLPAQPSLFHDYPATEPYKGHNVPVVLTKRDAEFRTRLRSAAAQRPNFAGHYIVSSWGCGATCVMGAAIDANTGRVHWFPFTICCWTPNDTDTFRPIDYRVDSRLIIFTGARDEKDGDAAAHYYEFRNGEFTEIKRPR
jgi:hypothetical protein